MKNPFNPDQVYHRQSDIHSKYGGNRRGGICPSKNFPFIFIFTGGSGAKHGYADRWENEFIFSYTGEGQKGDMEFIKGNLAIREHQNRGKAILLFEFVRKGFVKFICELEFLDADYFETHDTSGKMRSAIKFFFKKKNSLVPYSIGEQILDVRDRVETIIPHHIIPNKTERKGLVTSRVGQGAYRKSIIHRWRSKCAVTAFDKTEILIASHIVPWRYSTDVERLDVHNGILLSPIYDALFDRHLISFEDSGKIILSDSIDYNGYKKIGVSGKEKISNFSDMNKPYLDRHRLTMMK